MFCFTSLWQSLNMMLRLSSPWILGLTTIRWAIQGRVDDLSFFDYLSPLCFLLIEFHCTFSMSYKILQYFVYYYYILIRMWYAVRTSFFFVPALLLSILTPLFLPSSSVSLSYFVLAVPMRECLGKHLCMSSPFPITILNSTCFFSIVQLQVHNVYLEQKDRNSCALVNLCL